MLEHLPAYRRELRVIPSTARRGRQVGQPTMPFAVVVHVHDWILRAGSWARDLEEIDVHDALGAAVEDHLSTATSTVPIVVIAATMIEIMTLPFVEIFARCVLPSSVVFMPRN